MRWIIWHLFSLVYVTLAFSQKTAAQVNYQNGAAVTSIPVFTFSDNKSGLSLPIAINYNSGQGLRVDEIAGEVGQGWALMAGGRISRSQVGLPDDQKALGGEGFNLGGNGYENPNDNMKYPNGYLYTSRNASEGVPEYYHKYPVYPNKKTVYNQHNFVNADRELDYFIMNVNGTTATFVLKKNTYEGVFLGKTLMKVRFETVGGSTQSFSGLGGVSGTARTVINRFIVTDGNGIEYTFETKVYAKILRQRSSDPSFTNISAEPRKYKKRNVYTESEFEDASILNPYIVSDWLLTSIKDRTNPNRQITFQYEYKKMTAWTGFTMNLIDAKKNYAKIIASKSVVITPRLVSVTCPNSYNIGFEYGPERLDLAGANPIKSITVQYNGRKLKKILLDYTYVMFTRYGIPRTNADKYAARLYLAGAKELSTDLRDEDRAYVFDYYLGGSNRADFVPPPFFASKDIWGYYDGYQSFLGDASININNIKPGMREFCMFFNRGNIGIEKAAYDHIKKLCFYQGDGLTKVRSGYAKNGLLKSVQYPSGGRTEYFYEQNRTRFFGEFGSEQEVGGVHVSKTISYDDGYSNNCTGSKGVELNYKYINNDNSSSYWGVERPKNDYSSSSGYEAYGKRVKFRPWKPLLGIKCTYDYQYPGIPFMYKTSQPNFFIAAMSNPVVQVAGEIMGFVSYVQNMVKVTGYINSAAATVPVAAIVAVALDYLMAITEIISTCIIQDNFKTTNTTTWYNSNLKMANPLPMLYKRVELIENNGENGKTVMDFTSNDDYPVWEPVNPLFNKKQRFGSWLYGLPKKTEVFDASGNILKRTAYTYSTQSFCAEILPPGQQAAGKAKNISPAALNPGDSCSFDKIGLGMTSCYAEIKKAMPMRSIDWAAYTSNNTVTHTTTGSGELGVNRYDVYSGKIELRTTAETLFEQGNASKSLTKTTYYTYDNNAVVDILLPVRIVEIPASGLTTVKDIEYNNSYYSGVYAAMKNNNIYTMPVKVTTSASNASINNYTSMLQEITNYESIPNIGFRTQSIDLSRVQVPGGAMIGPATVLQNFNSSLDGITYASRDEGGRIIKNLLDYDEQLTVAQVINLKDALNETVAYTSFETSKGNGFSYGGAPVSGTCITGNQYYNLSYGGIYAAISNPYSRPYTLSFWATAQPSVTGATLVKNQTVRKGYTYFEYTVAAGTGNITINGSASIDELRLLPSDARMMTTSYDNYLRKISECDASNRFLAYEYDDRDRLRLIKDEYGSIVKMFEYNEKKNQEKCPTVFYNHAIFEAAQKNNCGPGYVGDYGEVSIPAGQFTSTVSQYDADMKAQQYLDDNLQILVNSNPSVACKQLFGNIAVSGTFYSETCADNQVPQPVVYSVPANTYFSTISQEDANDYAYEDLEDNGQELADNTGGCSNTTDPVWSTVGEPQYRCKTSNGVNTGKTEVLLTNVNPNSSTYNTTQWFEMSENVLDCQAPPAVPDLACTALLFPAVVHGQGTIYLRVNVSNIANTSSSGLITVFVSKDNKYNLQFNPSATTLDIFPVNNSSWTFDATSYSGFYRFTTNASIPGNDGELSFGVSGLFTAGASNGSLAISAMILSGSGGETNVSNNTDAETITYFAGSGLIAPDIPSGIVAGGSPADKEDKKKTVADRNAKIGERLYVEQNKKLNIAASADSEAEGLNLDFGTKGKLLIEPRHGTVKIKFNKKDGEIEYTPNKGYVGLDTLVYLTYIKDRFYTVFQVIEVMEKGKSPASLPVGETKGVLQHTAILKEDDK